MALTKISAAVYLLPGMVAKIKAPTYYIDSGTKWIENENGEVEEKALTQGFALQNDDVGDLELITGEPAVKYSHKKFASNKIYFFSAHGETSVVDVISVPIHDHSSIVTGGPAFGTYFTDDETLGGT